MKSNKLFKGIFITTVSLLLLSSSILVKKEELPRFMFPINPGVQNYLAGTMGELRPNHFHAGIDIKTFGQIDLPIYSIDDGFVSRIKVSRYGYGKVMYVEHPNGYTSVYAHLNKFSKELESYITDKQYEKETFEIELFPPAEKFSFKKGDVIAYSGNTGGSTGPHLHFEIRDIDQRPLNPLIFGFEEIKDRIAPTFVELALKPLSIDARIDHEFERTEVRIKRIGRSTYDAGVIEAIGTIGIEIDCFDRLDEVPNKNGVPYILMAANADTVFQYHMDAFSFYDTRCINQHIDYQVYQSKRARFQKCYHDDGNNLDNYVTNAAKGKLLIEKDSTYTIKVVLKDAYNNDAILTFKIKGKSPQKVLSPTTKPSYVTPRYTVYNNIIKAIFPESEDTMATLHVFPKDEKISYAYRKRNTTVFLLDLNKSLPDSMTYGENTIRFNFDTSIVPNYNVSYFYKNVIVDFFSTSLFDTLFVSPNVTQQYVEINSEKTPLKNGINITLKDIDSTAFLPQVKAYQISESGYPSFIGGSANPANNTYKFYSKELGKFALLPDNEAPKIHYIRHSGNTIVFSVRDNLSGIGDIKATLNGKWVLMEYDKHILTAKLKEENNTFAGDFELSVSDNAGNVSTFNKKL